MTSPAITTLVKMVESLPEPMQDKVVEKMREYLQELEHEQRWDETFAKTQDRLVAAAKRAKEEIKAGKAKPLNLNDL
jgi:tRNA uridine 5-carbamoylmethylation protein Kti12